MNGVAADEEKQCARVLLVDDHPSFSQGLACLMSREPDMKVAGWASNAEEALELDSRLEADLVLVDVMMGATDGIELARQLAARRSLRILGLSVVDEPTRIARMLRAGARGFALKTQPIAEIIQAARATLAGERYLPPSLREAVEPLASGEQPIPLELLTPREREVFDLLVQDLSNDEIGQRLSIAPRTVDTHRHHIMKKLGAHSLCQLVRLAARWGQLRQ